MAYGNNTASGVEVLAPSRSSPNHYGEWVAPNMFRWHKCKPGYVYVIDFGHGVYKIGRATDVDQRLRAFGEHELIMVFYEWANVNLLEREIHNRYRDRLIYGELFNLSSDDLIDLHYYWPSHSVWSGKKWTTR